MTTRPGIHWPSVFQFAFGSLATASFFAFSIAMLFMGLAQFSEGASLRTVDALPFISAAALFSLSLLSLPSATYSFARLVGRPIKARTRLTWYSARAAIWLLAPVIGLGFLASTTPALAWIFLPPIHILATGLPLLWYLSIGGRHLKNQPAQRNWGAFGAGMALSLVPIFTLELLFGALVLVIIVVILSGEPGFMSDLQTLANRLSTATNPDVNLIIPFLEKYFLDVRVLAIGGIYVAVLVPIIEEAFKPIGMIFLNQKILTPADGFLVGMLSGAGFAFIESVLQAASGEAWWTVVAGRVGTGLIHITNSGLVGMGIAIAIREKAYIKMAGYYLLAVLIHGLWNGFAVLASLGYTPELDIQGIDRSILETIGLVSPIALLALAVAILGILIRLNRRFRLPTGELQNGANEIIAAEPEEIPGTADKSLETQIETKSELFNGTHH